MQQALIPLAAAAGLVALAGGAAALWMRSPDATPKDEEPEAEHEYSTPEPQAESTEELEAGGEDEDPDDDEELKATEE